MVLNLVMSVILSEHLWCRLDSSSTELIQIVTPVKLEEFIQVLLYFKTT